MRRNRGFRSTGARMRLEPEPAPPSRPHVFRRYLIRFYARFHTPLLIGAGILVTLAALFIYNAFSEPPQRLTQDDIDAAVERSLQSIEPGPSFASQAYEIIYPSLVRIQTISLDEKDEIGGAMGTGVVSGILTSLDAIFEDRQSQADSSRDNVLGREEEQPAFEPVAPGSYPHAVIVLLTDGESNRGPDPLEAAREAMDRGVRVFTVDVGSPDGTILECRGLVNTRASGRGDTQSGCGANGRPLLQGRQRDGPARYL